MSKDAVSREDVKDYYAKAGATPHQELCCPTAYRKGDVSHIPPEVMEVSYGCGSPVTIADLKPGETHVDLGCGGGIDCFIAAKLAGKKGKSIGIDMTPEMMERANRNADKVAKSLGHKNTEFKYGYLEEIPLKDKEADLVTSNCVVNLSEDKKKVFEEIYRVLKDDGRYVIADVVSEGPIPENMKKDRDLWGECLSGALTEDEFINFSKAVGFKTVEKLERTYFKDAEGHKFWSVTFRGWKTKKEAAASSSCCAGGGCCG